MSELPPGQRSIGDFPRFGVPAFANRLPQVPAELALKLAGVEEAVVGLQDLTSLPRIEVVADFHCVTTWTRRGLTWSGWRFRDFHEKILVPRVRAQGRYIRLTALDGYTACVALEELLGDEVLLADRLDGESIPVAHGAPLRLVVPHLYGYKSIKHVCAIQTLDEYRRSYAERLTRAHPRGRVALEERGRWLPGAIYRFFYRAFVPVTRWYFRRADRRLGV